MNTTGEHNSCLCFNSSALSSNSMVLNYSSNQLPKQSIWKKDKKMSNIVYMMMAQGGTYLGVVVDVMVNSKYSQQH